MSQWIKCNERMPEYYQSVLICDESDDVAIGVMPHHDVKAVGHFRLNNDDLFLASHWMYLPEFPEGD